MSSKNIIDVIKKRLEDGYSPTQYYLNTPFENIVMSYDEKSGEMIGSFSVKREIGGRNKKYIEDDNEISYKIIFKTLNDILPEGIWTGYVYTENKEDFSDLSKFVDKTVFSKHNYRFLNRNAPDKLSLNRMNDTLYNMFDPLTYYLPEELSNSITTYLPDYRVPIKLNNLPDELIFIILENTPINKIKMLCNRFLLRCPENIYEKIAKKYYRIDFDDEKMKSILGKNKFSYKDILMYIEEYPVERRFITKLGSRPLVEKFWNKNQEHLDKKYEKYNIDIIQHYFINALFRGDISMAALTYLDFGTNKMLKYMFRTRYLPIFHENNNLEPNNFNVNDIDVYNFAFGLPIFEEIKNNIFFDIHVTVFLKEHLRKLKMIFSLSDNDGDYWNRYKKLLPHIKDIIFNDRMKYNILKLGNSLGYLLNPDIIRQYNEEIKAMMETILLGDSSKNIPNQDFGGYTKEDQENFKKTLIEIFKTEMKEITVTERYDGTIYTTRNEDYENREKIRFWLQSELIPKYRNDEEAMSILNEINDHASISL